MCYIHKEQFCVFVCLCIVAVCALRKERVSDTNESVGFNSDTDDGGKPKCLTHPFSLQFLGCGAPGLSGLSSGNFTPMMAMTSDGQSPSHPGVPFLTQRAQRPGTHALPRANTGHPNQSRLNSLAMCTRPAMWTRSDDVPRKKRTGDLGWGEVRWNWEG